jgi:3-hydroxybutyryl-CoA dehydrogenase
MDIKRVAILGAGTMGAGIASVVGYSDFDALLIDINDGLLAKAKTRIEKVFERRVEKGLMTNAQKAAALQRIAFSTNLDDARESQLLIEAVSENSEIKRKVFAQLAGVLPEGMIIGSNTSALRISDLAVLTRQPDRVLGIHFFNPAPVMELVEVVATPLTSAETVRIVTDFLVGLGKQPVVVKESCGFIVNRVLFPMINEAALLFSEGAASAKDIDKAMMLGANHPIGPLALADLVGLDVCLAIMETLRDGLGSNKYEPATILRKLVQAGHLGKKSGAGFHQY